MRISPEGALGLWLGVIALAGGGAIMVWPSDTWIGWTLIGFATAGGALLIYHHASTWQWPAQLDDEGARLLAQPSAPGNVAPTLPPQQPPAPVSAADTAVATFHEQASLLLRKLLTETRVSPRMKSWPIHAVTDEVKLLKLATWADVIVVHKITSLTTETDDLANKVVSLLRDAAGGFRPGKAVASPAGFVGEVKRLKELLVLLRGNDVWVYADEHEKLLPESWDEPKEELDWESTEKQAIVAFGAPGLYGEDTVSVDLDNGCARIIKPLLKGV